MTEEQRWLIEMYHWQDCDYSPLSDALPCERCWLFWEGRVPAHSDGTGAAE